ncbi:MAG: UGMP family protein [Euryarchaeota archaeon]|nr:UGMP family protein [Euryarchaeota archaeon]
MNKVIIGVESTAHTFSFGLVTLCGIPRKSHSALYRPEEGGIHPREAADHHSELSSQLIDKLMKTEKIDRSQIEAIAYSQGPGLGPCLRIGANVSRALAEHWQVPLIGVNHCVAHIEIGRNQTGCKDPVLLYVSGGNTQVIARAGDRYQVLGETLDIGIGNMLDKFARTQGLAFPGGPKIEKLAKEWHELNPAADVEEIPLPYSVQGMDLNFSGLLNAALQRINEGHELGAVCWSLQEHAFSACIEVAERALAHTGKRELLLGGGVACNERIREMTQVMCGQRGSIGVWPEKQYCIDNGTMIAELGRRMLESNSITKYNDSLVNPSLRTDHTLVEWD